MDKEELATLAAALGLPAGTALDQITAHCRDLTASAQKTPVTTATPDPALFVPMSAFADLQTTVAALVQSDATSRAQTAVDEAMRAGKVTPALQPWALAYASQNPDGFKAWLGASPVIVPPGSLLPNTPPATAAQHAAQQDDKAVLAVCANLGITVEQYRKTQGITTAQNTGASA